MNMQELAQLIEEHSFYCQTQYQPYKLKHLSMDKALEFMNEQMQSLTHFAMWLTTVKKNELED